MKLFSVFRLFCFISLVHCRQTVAQQHRHNVSLNDSNINSVDDSLLGEEAESPTPAESALFLGRSVGTAPLCERPCLMCTGEGTQQKCTACVQGFSIFADNKCHEIALTLSNDEAYDEDAPKDSKKALIAAIFIMLFGIGMLICGLVALFYAYCREECCHRSAQLVPGFDDVNEGGIATSQHSTMSSPSHRATTEMAVVIVHNPDDAVAVAVEK